MTKFEINNCNFAFAKRNTFFKIHSFEHFTHIVYAQIKNKQVMRKKNMTIFVLHDKEILMAVCMSAHFFVIIHKYTQIVQEVKHFQ